MSVRRPTKLVVFTGLDGSGTTSLARAVHALDRSSSLVATPPPPFVEGRQGISLHVRERSPAAHYMFYLAGVIYASKVIEGLLERGNVYCVRHLIDTVVSHRALGLSVELVYETELYSIRAPDHIFLIRTSEAIRQKRLENRGKNLLDRTLDDPKFRSRFEVEYARLSKYYTVVSNDHGQLDDTAKMIANMLGV